jgi:hypothetical protein
MYCCVVFVLATGPVPVGECQHVSLCRKSTKLQDAIAGRAVKLATCRHFTDPWRCEVACIQRLQSRCLQLFVVAKLVWTTVMWMHSWNCYWLVEGFTSLLYFSFRILVKNYEAVSCTPLPPNYKTVYFALWITKQLVTSFELKKSFLCSTNYEVVSCVLKITRFLPSILRNSFLYLPNYETVHCALWITKYFLTSSELKNSSLCPTNREEVFCVLKITKEYLFTPYDGTVCCTFRITEVYCALRITKQLLLRTSEQIIVPFDLTRQFLVRCEFRKSLWLPPNHGTVSCTLRSTNPFLAYWELRNSTPNYGKVSCAFRITKQFAVYPNNQNVSCVPPVTEQFLASLESWLTDRMLFAAQILVLLYFCFSWLYISSYTEVLAARNK